MKKLCIFPVFVILTLGFSEIVRGQATSSTWALTSSPGAPSVLGNVTAANIAKGSDVGTMSFNADGVSAIGWESGSLNADDYYQYSITPANGNNLTVTSISFQHRIDIGDGGNSARMNGAVYYSLNADFSGSSQIGSNFTVGTSFATFTASSLNIGVNDGQTLYVRIYGWGALNTRCFWFICWDVISPNSPFRNSNVVISGTTTAATSITTGTISGSPFCPGGAVSVPYTITGTFNSGNIFTTQLSDASGDFGSPVNIGSRTATDAGTISATIPSGTTTGTGYRIRVVSDNPAVTGSENGTDLAVITSLTWNGSVSSDWKASGNWTPAFIPVACSDVIIPDVSSINYPVVSSSTSDAVCNNLTINAMGKLTVDGTLTLSGNAVIHSTADGSNSSLIVNGTMALGTGHTVTYNRQLDTDRWWIVSSPVNVSTGFGVNNDKISDYEGSYDFAWYKEPNNEGWQYDWNTTDGLPDELTSGEGYLIGTKDDGIIAFTGTLNGDPLEKAVTNTPTRNGWNAVGNPYTSAIGITADASSSGKFLAVNEDVLEDNYGAIYVWNEDAAYSGSEQYYKAIGNSGYNYSGQTSLSEDYVQAGQGFLINAGGTGGDITFTKAMQVHEPGVTLKSAGTPWYGLALLALNGSQIRNATIAFHENMTTGLDKTFDAGLLASDNFQVYTRLLTGDNGIDFTIQCLPSDGMDNLVIPVGLDLPGAGRVTFYADGVILPSGLYPVLEDRGLNIFTPLKTPSDSYSVDFTTSSWGTGRFYLHLRCDGTTPFYLDADNDGYGNPGVSLAACVQPPGYVADNTDCDDTNPLFHASFGFYPDNDGDGYGAGVQVELCAPDANTPPTGYSVNNTDCNDAEELINPGVTEICDDGIDNNCDGNADEGCVTCIYETIDTNGFESGWGIWTDGGTDCALVRSYPNAGRYSVQLRDNTSTSLTTTRSLDLTACDELTVSFSYYPVSMDNASEDFWLQLSTDGGATFQTMEEWNLHDEFVNKTRYNESVVISGPFTAATRLRFRCDASDDNDLVYIDDIVIAGCKHTGSSSLKSADLVFKNAGKPGYGLKVYPNPFTREISLMISGAGEEEQAHVAILDMAGRILYNKKFSVVRQITLNDLALPAGTYFVRVQLDGAVMTDKLVRTE